MLEQTKSGGRIMPLNVIRKEIEAEREIGYKYLQVLGRAEALVPGAGREAIDVLLWDANAAIIRADVQNDRVVLDGTLSCQAVYRQGEENSLRALSAKSTISQVTEIPGAQGGMLSRVHPVVEGVEARYENGHMVFLVSLGIHVRVMKLEPLEIIEGIEDGENLETLYKEICLTKLAAEASETAVLTERVELPRSLDARATLMDWGCVSIDSSEPDLGGVRVKGRATVETLVASGIEGRPAVLVKYPIEFDKLIELPEWLSRNACVMPSIRSIRTQLEPPEEDEDGTLLIQADVHFSIASNMTECVSALADVYSTSGSAAMAQTEDYSACIRAICLRSTETVRGTVLLEEGAPAVGSVIAVRVLPNIAEVRSGDGKTTVSGLLDAGVLYMAVGSDLPASANTQLPFEIELPGELGDEAVILLHTAAAEANALMSDRLEMKITLNIDSEARLQENFSLATDVAEEGEIMRRPGYVICWPDDGDDAWSIGRRYGVPSGEISAAMGGRKIMPGNPLVLRI